MRAAQIQLVRSSFEQVRPQIEVVAAMFYDRLFAIDPSTRPLFKGDMQKQHLLLMSALSLVVQALDHPETILPWLQSLGQRHVAYGVTRQQYPSVGQALLWSLEQALGPSCTTEVRAAWSAAYRLVSRLMLAATAKTTGTASVTTFMPPGDTN